MLLRKKPPRENSSLSILCVREFDEIYRFRDGRKNRNEKYYRSGQDNLSGSLGSFIRKALPACGVMVNDGENNLYSAHSARGGGAMALALAGIPIQEIQVFGRWKSEAVMVYVLNAPLLSNVTYIANAMKSKIAKTMNRTRDQVDPANGDHVIV